MVGKWPMVDCYFKLCTEMYNILTHIHTDRRTHKITVKVKSLTAVGRYGL